MFRLIFKCILVVLLVASMVIGIYRVFKYGCDSFSDH